MGNELRPEIVYSEYQNKRMPGISKLKALTIILKNQIRLSYLLLFAASISNALLAQTTTPAIKDDLPSDSIQFVINGDTLNYKQKYSIEFPVYSIDDSLPKKDKQVPGRSQGNSASGLAATGSISRGIQVSSNASVSLQSSMYLKIKGSLSEHYTVSGVLTDKTSPLQPIGNTRRLNDFDRVLVNVTGPAMSASVGDIDLHQSNGKFGKLDRSIEGLDFHAKSGLAQMHSSLGFSYGKYYLQQIQGKDGKQGPYRLSGKNGEKFIIVLAGSEKVKVNDQLLQRGEEDDYIIDYNAAEITFTQNRILSSNSRISVEFEYVPDIYLASYSFGKQLISGGFSLGDREHSPFFISAAWQQLKDDQKNPLGNVDADRLIDVFAGLADSVQTTWLSSVTSDTINGDYRVDENGVLVYAGDGLGNLSVDFSFVGLEQGQYRKILNSIGSYFIYDTLQGEYLPSQRLFAPESQSVLSVHGRASAGNITLDVDLGVSQNVKNLYATTNSNNSENAWNVKLSSVGRYLGLMLGDKHYSAGFRSHDVLESNEYYRRWQVASRNGEDEHLNYGHLRIGKTDGSFVRGEASRLARSGEIMGQQIQLEAKTKQNAPIELAVKSYLTDHNGNFSQQHALHSALNFSKVRAVLRLNAEDGVDTPHYPSNDHLTSGIGLNYTWSANQKLALNFDQRQDYRLAPDQGVFLSAENIKLWQDQRQDWATEYTFVNILNTDGRVQLKFREHHNDSSAVTRYYLGNIQFTGNALKNRLRFQERFLIDEEHIPKYDYHYMEVDTGYGDYSYDPIIMDYIPISGGRYIRQRVFSDIEEQVRKYENKTRLEFTSSSYGKPDKIGFRSRFSSELRVKLQVENGTRIQDQAIQILDLSYQTGRQTLLNKLNYSGKSSNNHSTLYNFGDEDNLFRSHEINGNIIWNNSNSSKIGLSYENRERTVEYNPLATESWVSFRPFIEYTYILSQIQKYGLLIKYSQVDDLHLNQTYQEGYAILDHKLRIKRRGRVDQKLSLSRIQADVSGIPYSVFSGRQPGNNWKYTLNGRYTFSNRFQMTLNYSLQKRGLSRTEQFLRVEGRTHF